MEIVDFTAASILVAAALTDSKPIEFAASRSLWQYIILKRSHLIVYPSLLHIELNSGVGFRGW